MSRRKNEFRMRSRRQMILIYSVLIVLLVGGYFLAQHLEREPEIPEPEGDYLARRGTTIEVDGHSYWQRGNVTTILLMGIDHDSITTSGFRNGGQADFLRLLVIDPEERHIVQIPIDRDTMMPITILGVLGNESGVRTERISLSHSFGDGKEMSCELTRRALSNMMLGIRIDFYVALNMDGIAVLNDTLGGVEVVLQDDFTAFHPDWKPGRAVVLHGDDATTFVRSRMSVSDGTNVSRMRRQQQYLSAAGHVLESKISDDADFIGKLFDALSPYMISNISRANIVNLAYHARNYARREVSIPGIHEVDEEGFMAFYADKDKVKEIVIQYICRSAE